MLSCVCERAVKACQHTVTHTHSLQVNDFRCRCGQRRSCPLEVKECSRGDGVEVGEQWWDGVRARASFVNVLGMQHTQPAEMNCLAH